MNLLIVNDEVRTADVMKSEIDWTAYGIDQVSVAYDAEMGREVIGSGQIDILLCDIEMPGESGLELLKWVREKKLPIECIFLTCHAKFAYAQEAIGLGCQDYILVPAKYEDIGRAVLKVVERIRTQRDADRYQEYGKAYIREKKEQTENRKEAPRLTPEEISSGVKEYVMRHISEEELSVNSIAEQFHFHPVYLNRVFKQQEGLSLSQYIINTRMGLAASLLTEGDMAPADVAEQVGYRYYESFHNMFRKVYECTPAQYRDRHRQEP